MFIYYYGFDFLKDLEEILNSTLEQIPQETMSLSLSDFYDGKVKKFEYEIKEDVMSCRAKIIGNTIYSPSVKFLSDRMLLNCSCEHFRKGNICKHVSSIIMKIIQEKGILMREANGKHGKIESKEKIRFAHQNYEVKKEFDKFKLVLSKNISDDVDKSKNVVYRKIVELEPKPDAVEIYVSEKKIGKNNTPLKTGAKILEYNELVFSNSKLFKSLSESIAFSRNEENSKLKNRHFELIDFRKFKDNFRHYPY
ncbi:MAG: hypothetical protein EOM23_06525, partial [Candidatus Moranbacteria bacterium]|nr:hypothetical protein [Candidatus Moranbacteria bacterium]